jgi:hypothetical protein
MHLSSVACALAAPLLVVPSSILGGCFGAIDGTQPSGDASPQKTSGGKDS